MQQFAILAKWSWLTSSQSQSTSLSSGTMSSIWLGKTTNSCEHSIASKDNTGKVFYTCNLTRLTPELQWDKKVFDNIDIPRMDTSMNEDYVEEKHIGKTIIDKFFTMTRLNQKKSGN
eukprot:3178206-Amphidinium_carterae.1